MKIHIKIAIVVIASMISLCYGLSAKKTFLHADINSEQSFDNYSVFALDSVFLEGRQDYISSQQKVLDDAELILVVKVVGDRKNKSGTLIQEVKIDDVVKGNQKIEGKEISVIDTMYGVNTINGYVSCFVDLLQKEKSYLIFVNTAGEDYSDKYVLANQGGISYFCLDESQSNVISAGIGETKINYELAKGNELYAIDEESLEVLKKLKKDNINKYLKSDK